MANNAEYHREFDGYFIIIAGRAAHRAVFVLAPWP